MNNLKICALFAPLLSGALTLTLAGCGARQSQQAAPPPPTTLTAQEQQAVDGFKNLSPAQQQAFMRNNPKLAQNPLVVAQMRESMMKR